MRGKDPTLAATGRMGCCCWQCRDAELAALAVWDLRHTQHDTIYRLGVGRRQGGSSSWVNMWEEMGDSKETLPR